MAVSETNLFTKNFRGRVGNLILRVVGEKTVLSCMPTFTNRKWSEAQLACQDRFRKATKYGHKVMKDAEKKQFYDAKANANQSGWNLAISDYMIKPKIVKIDVSEYGGKKGDKINIEAFDQFKVASVIVMIINAAGVQTESGMAVEMLSGEWVYKAGSDTPGWEGGCVEVKVIDLPGNVVKEEVIIGET